jgi:hypothetical protein
MLNAGTQTFLVVGVVAFANNLKLTKLKAAKAKDSKIKSIIINRRRRRRFNHNKHFFIYKNLQLTYGKVGWIRLVSWFSRNLENFHDLGKLGY